MVRVMDKNAVEYGYWAGYILPPSLYSRRAYIPSFAAGRVQPASNKIHILYEYSQGKGKGNL